METHDAEETGKGRKLLSGRERSVLVYQVVALRE